MDVDAVSAELELNLARRLQEVAFLKNQIGALNASDQRDLLRRSAVLVLYAHFEGYCKFVFTAYVESLNSEGLKCADVSFAIAAASMSDVFTTLRDVQRKSPEFVSILPDDTSLHRFALEREFVERADDINRRTVSISDQLADPESNLKPAVLRKILFRLGLPHDLLEDVEGDINMLLRFRNEIAHGVFLSGIQENQFEKFERAAMRVLREVTRQVIGALAMQRYLRKHA